LAKYGSRLVFPADEFYLLAEQKIPSYADYEEFNQLENGVGMIAQFRQQAVEVLQEAEPLELDRITLITGRLFQDELVGFAEQLSLKAGVDLDVVAINNSFFGADITVTGLITGADLLNQLENLTLGEAILLPDVMLKDGGQLFLDDMSIEDLSSSLHLPVIAVETSPWGILDGLESLAAGSVEIIHV